MPPSRNRKVDRTRKDGKRPADALTPETGLIEISRYVRPWGLELDDSVEYREWYSIGQVLVHMYEWTPKAIGDWLAFGERQFGETYAQAAEVTGRTVKTLYNLSYICRNVPPDLRERYDELDIGHYDVVAGMERPEQEHYLQLAHEEDDLSGGNLTVAAFREMVKEDQTNRAARNGGRMESPPAPPSPESPASPNAVKVERAVEVDCPQCHGRGRVVEYEEVVREK